MQVRNDAPWPPPVAGDAEGPARLTVIDAFNEFRVTVNAAGPGWHLNWVDHQRGYHSLGLGYRTWLQSVLSWSDRSLAVAGSAAWQADRSFLIRLAFPGRPHVLDISLANGTSAWTWNTPPAGGAAPYDLALTPYPGL